MNRISDDDAFVALDVESRGHTSKRDVALPCFPGWLKILGKSMSRILAVLISSHHILSWTKFIKVFGNLNCANVPLRGVDDYCMQKGVRCKNLNNASCGEVGHFALKILHTRIFLRLFSRTAELWSMLALSQNADCRKAWLLPLSCVCVQARSSRRT